jgi:hypothetical protein
MKAEIWQEDTHVGTASLLEGIVRVEPEGKQTAQVGEIIERARGGFNYRWDVPLFRTAMHALEERATESKSTRT